MDFTKCNETYTKEDDEGSVIFPWYDNIDWFSSRP